MQSEDVVHLHRFDAARNMARFYRLTSMASLFGDVCVVRDWGRIGRPGRMRIDLYEKVEGAAAARHMLQQTASRLSRRVRSGMTFEGSDQDGQKKRPAPEVARRGPFL